MTTADLIKETKELLGKVGNTKSDLDRQRFFIEMSRRLVHLESLILAERNPDVLKEMMSGFRDELLVPFRELFTDGKKLFPEQIKVGGEIYVTNQPKDIRVNNLEDIKFPSKFEIANFPSFPKEIRAKSPSFPRMVKELGLISALLTKIYNATGKAVVTGELMIKNTKPADAIPVKLVTPDGKSFYAAITQLLGGSGSSETKLRNSSNTIINPATEEKQDDIIAALGGAGASSVGDGTATVTTAGTRVQLSNVACKKVYIQAHESNTGTIVVGGSTCVGALSGRRGVALFPTQSQSFEVSNLNLLYIDSTANGDKINYYYEVA